MKTFPFSLPPCVRLILAAACLMTAAHAVEPRARVIVDNDFGGDPDGLFQLAHQLLSPSVEVRGIIGSHHYPKGFFGYPGTAAHACESAEKLLEVMGMKGKVAVHAGAEGRMEQDAAPLRSAAAEFIVKEAMRDDVKTPLYLACGAGLTDVASAWLMEPRIAERVRLIWIGGREHDGLAEPPPGASRIEYNLGIDLKAAQVVFNDSTIPIWQVPRDAYRQALVSTAELRLRMKQSGKPGEHLMAALDDMMRRAYRFPAETYVVGDSPLVLLTALHTPWEADTASSRHVVMPTPEITGDGKYVKRPEARSMRVYTHIDTRLMMEDFHAKLIELSMEK